jgi:hypothetical protein
MQWIFTANENWKEYNILSDRIMLAGGKVEELGAQFY